MTAVALSWGFAEATLFFVIPDVLLTYVAVRLGPGPAWRAAWWATAGAVAGGMVMWAWGGGAAPVLATVPAIDGALVDGAWEGVAAQGSSALVAGAFEGVPYKLFAAAAGDLGAHPAALAAWTVVGRMSRFAVAVGVAAAATRFMAAWLSPRMILASWAAFWVGVYAAYWM